MQIDNIECITTSTNTCKIIGYNGDKTEIKEITIPKEVKINNENYAVSSIGDDVFRGCESLKKITLPLYLTSLGDCVFRGCRSLEEVVCPINLTYIGNNVFSHCFSLRTVTLPVKLKFIGNKAFYGCISLTTITMPKLINSIGEEMFKDCYSLTSVTLQNGISSIGKEAFENCRSLKEVVLSESLTSIGDRVFKNCCSLTSISLPNKISSIGKEVFYGCKSLTSVYLSDKITSLEDAAFCNCESLKEVSLPSELISMKNEVFRNCTSLTSLTLPDRLISMGNKVFMSCESLKEISLPNAIEHIGSNCLSYENGYPLFLPNIGLLIYNKGTHCYGWFGDRNIKKITIPDGVKYINYSEFNKLKKIKTLELPDSLDFDVNKAIVCKKLEPGLLLSIKGTKCYGYLGDIKKVLEIIIPEGVTHIQEGAFNNCVNLERITISSTVTHLGNNILNGCKSLKEIVLPDNFVCNLNLSKCPFQAKYKRVLELNKLAIDVYFKELKNLPGGKNLKITGLGTDCFELSLIYKSKTLWKSIFKTIQIPDILDLIKEKAANFKKLYAERQKQ